MLSPYGRAADGGKQGCNDAGVLLDAPSVERQEAKWRNALEAHVLQLDATGFTSLWLPPGSKAANWASMGYDPYDYFDLAYKENRTTSSKERCFHNGKTSGQFDPTASLCKPGREGTRRRRNL